MTSSSHLVTHYYLSSLKTKQNCKHNTTMSIIIKHNNNKPNSRTSNSTTHHHLLVVLFIFFLFSHASSESLNNNNNYYKTPAPLPILPIPTSHQLQWHLSEMALFLHFGPNTFTDSEWGSGHASPSVFNPSSMDTAQWASTAAQNGFKRVILTAKHHDGFCLWPTEYTDYSVRSSPYEGDVVGELAETAGREGLELGVYLSPWDRHEGRYGKTVEYNEFFLAQMTELLTRYGLIREVWLDGAKGEGEKDMEYYFDIWFSLIHQLQPQAMIFSDAGPDVRWVGNEAGSASSTCWSTFNRSDAKIGETDPKYSQEGDIYGHDWVPAECDVSIRPGWFWHPSESPKSAKTLLEIYYNSVGRNCLFLLNVPPNSSGLISDEDVKVLQEFTELRKSIFSHNLAKNAHINASSSRGGLVDNRFSPRNVLEESIYSYWAPEENQVEWILYMEFENKVSFNVLQVQEPIQLGQRIVEFHLDALDEKGRWGRVINGTTVGYKRLLRFPEVVTYQLRFVVDKCRADPLVAYLAIHLDTVSDLSSSVTNYTSSYLNRTGVIDQVVYNHSHFVKL